MPASQRVKKKANLKLKQLRLQDAAKAIGIATQEKIKLKKKLGKNVRIQADINRKRPTKDFRIGVFFDKEF